jgi:hypothetical protein
MDFEAAPSLLPLPDQEYYRAEYISQAPVRKVR